MVALAVLDTFLSSGTLAGDLRYGRPEATGDGVARAAGAASVTEFAQGLPDGLDSQIPAAELRRSGRQRRWVGIARAVLVNPLVVVIDEPPPRPHMVPRTA
jgi:ABC-type multidrug transport system fused ATPase/permease subunit